MTSPSKSQPTNYRQALPDDQSLAVFLRKMAEFDKAFCDAMARGDDYTLRLEIRGNCGELIHARVHNDSFARPAGVEKRIESKQGE